MCGNRIQLASEKKSGNFDIEFKNVVIAIITLAMLVFSAIFICMKSSIKTENQPTTNDTRTMADENSMTLESTEKTIITPDSVAEYCNKKAVCVEYSVGYIGSNRYYIYLNPEKNSDFSVLISAEDITQTDAEKTYLGKYIRVYGEVTRYEYKHSGKQIYQIKLSSLENITIVE